MKSTTKILPVAKVPNPASTPATETCNSSSQQASMIPTLETLAALAASMAIPTEEPNLSVYRAIRLFMECREQYHILVRAIETEERLAKMCDAAQTESREFLAKCGLSQRDIEIALADTKQSEGIRVPLDRFLHGCKPRPESKLDYMKSEWRAYRGQQVKCPGMSQTDLLHSVDEAMRTDRENGLSISAVWNHRTMFIAFLDRNRKAKRSEASKKGGRPKKSLGDIKTAHKTL